MPYSRAKEKRQARSVRWPDIRYSPTGEAKLFYAPEEVPPGWSAKVPVIRFNAYTGPVLDRDELVAQLTSMGIEINPTWGVAHMKKVIDGDASPTG